VVLDQDSGSRSGRPYQAAMVSEARRSRLHQARGSDQLAAAGSLAGLWWRAKEGRAERQLAHWAGHGLTDTSSCTRPVRFRRTASSLLLVVSCCCSRCKKAVGLLARSRWSVVVAAAARKRLGCSLGKEMGSTLRRLGGANGPAALIL
jgi:hypothetical protein